MVLWDDLRQQLVLALGQLHKGTHTVDVGIDLNVKDVVPPCKGKVALGA